MKVIPEWLDEMPAFRLAALSFNLVVIGWLMMEVTFPPSGGVALMPCSYLQPNFVNMAGFAFFAAGASVSLLAITRGGLIFAALSLSFVWNFACTLMREAGLLQGLPIH
jgi:hypothetical protein